MEHNTNKEKWLNDVLGSTSGIRRAQPVGGLYERVMTRMSSPQQQAHTISFPVKRWVAAAIILLALNISSVLYYTGRTTGNTSSSGSDPLATEMQTSSTYNY